MKMPPVVDRIRRAFSVRSSPTVADLDRFMDDAIGGKASATGVRVSESSALATSAVWACVRLLSETVASLPLPLYRKLPRGKERAYEHPLYALLHDQPNPEMPAIAFREALQGHLCTWGNAYAEIEYDLVAGTIKSLWPLRPDRMAVKRESNGQIRYYYKLPNNQTTILPAYQVFHIPGFGFDGLVGYSPIALARETVGLALATEEFGARFFGNGAKVGGILEHPGKLSPQAHENLRKSFNSEHQGLTNALRLAILEEGMKYQQVGIPPEDAQFLETRKFQVREIARWFHVPPHMIADLEQATFSNIEHQGIEYVVYSARPWLVRWEQYISTKLLGPEERKDYLAEFVVQGLLRGDVQARYNAYAIGRQNGWLSANDIRELENMNPLPGEEGDIYLVPLNMVPTSELGQKDTTPAADPQAAPHTEGEARGGKRKMYERQRIATSFLPIFRDAAGRILERERQNVARAAKKHLEERSLDSWNQWLADFYRDFPEYISRQILPAVKGLGDAVEPVAADEVKSKAKADGLDDFHRKYAQAFAARYAESSQGQLKALAAEADPLVAVDDRLDEWEQTRPDKVARNETTQVANAVAKFVFAAAGITKLIWRNTGSDTCPFCSELDGTVVGIEQDFVTAGSAIEGPDGKQMKSWGPKRHPPIHAGCQCVIEPA
ncbi:MAG: phage portal protein [bacterium]